MRYRVVCTDQVPVNESFKKAHIIAVGVGNDPNAASERLTLEQVLIKMDSGDTFYTQGPISGKIAQVVSYHCSGCGKRHIKSSADNVTDNNLDYMRGCQWQPSA